MNVSYNIQPNRLEVTCSSYGCVFGLPITLENHDNLI